MNKESRRLLLFLAAFVISLNMAAQKEVWPKTLLWKISGRELKKPSYLFGTMHLQDKRIFNLGDSFYHHFERAEGFAIEVNFNEYMDTLLTQYLQIAEQKHLRDEEETEGVKEEIKEARIQVDSAVQVEMPPPPKEDLPGVKSTRADRKEYRKLRNEQLKSILLYGRMPTILDAYLYGMAMKQGKWLGAVEEVKDQLSIRDELGQDIDEDEEDEKPAITRFSLEKMIKIYLDQDLNQVEEYLLDRSSKKSKTVIFNNRNVKMLRSIDSLSRLRSMFYAVGAAHLPGDSGLIKLLRQKGYTVTPVLSGKTMAAEKYAANLPSLSWYEVGQADGLYKVDMPGIPTEYNVFGELVKMKIFLDITTMNFYMAGHSIAQFDDGELEKALRNMAESMKGKLSSVKKADRDGIRAAEGTLSNSSGTFRIQVLKKGNNAFFLLVGSSPGSRIPASDADKFFASFRAGDMPVTEKKKDWKEFILDDKAVRVELPMLPKRNRAFERQAEGTGWNFSVYDCTDPTAGLYYLFQVRDINAGHFLDGDSAYFEEFKKNITKEKATVLMDETGNWQGYPMLRFDAESDADKIFYKTKNVLRGNRVYSLMVLGHISRLDDPGPGRYFSSLKLLDYKETTWNVQSADDGSFHAKAPDQFVRVKPDEDEEDDSTRVHYTSYDAYEVTSYEVLKDRLPDFYWVSSDTGFYRKKAGQAQGYADSLLSYRFVWNGKIRGVEQLVQSPASNLVKKIRYLLHGDTLYTLISFVTKKSAGDQKHSNFFESFRIANDHISSSILQSKIRQLTEALAGKDSLQFEKAKSVLGSLDFTKDDLPYLHKALLPVYPDDSTVYGSVRSSLIEALEDLSDSSTVDFIRRHYDELKERGSDQLALLNVLVNQRTRYAYETLRDLFTGKPPVNLRDRTGIGYRVTDSLELTRILFPDILGLLKNKDYWQDVTDYTDRLLDSGMLKTDIIMPWEKQLVFIADTLVKGGSLNQEDVWSWNYESLVGLLGKLNTAESNKQLAKILLQRDLYLKQAAALCLLKNGENVSPEELEKLAASNDYRLELYEELKKIKKESFFPAKYLTQRFFAEAQLYQYGSDDYSPSAMEYIGVKDVMFDGEKSRFFLFRVEFGGEDEEAETESYLGIAGPYSIDGKSVETSNDGTEINYDESFDKKAVDKHFRLLIEKGEEYVEKRKNGKSE